MKKLFKNQKGVIALITVLVLLAVGTLGVGMVISSQLGSSSSNNYSNKIKTYAAADGAMTLLAQDILDFNDGHYSLTGTDTIHLEAENMTLSLYTIEGNTFSSNGNLIRMNNLGQTGTASVNFSGATGTYKVNVTYFDESDGASTYKVFVNNVQVDTWVANLSPGDASPDASTKMVRTIANISITNGNQVRIEGTPTIGSEWARVDCIDFQPLVQNTFTDTVKIGKDSIPVIYTINKLGSDLFSMSTNAYVLKGSTSSHDYETHLTQTLARQRQGKWLETAKDSALIPVTLYDFRADNSCPEFQVAGKLMKNMVRDTLDAYRKLLPKIPTTTFRTCMLGTYPLCYGSDWYTIPTATRFTRYATIGWDMSCLENCMSTISTSTYGWFFNDSMYTWFRPYGDSTNKTGTYTFDTNTGEWSGLKKRPKYNSSTAKFTDSVSNEWVTAHWDSTKPFANIVMYDSLMFRRSSIDSTVYTFGDSSWIYTRDGRWFVKDCNCTYSAGGGVTYYFNLGEFKFMPLKNRGFKYDASKWFPKSFNACVDQCNFSFTMEIHRKFTYKPGQTFYFRGDDDVWVFINNKLVIDLGGSHTVENQNVLLDTIHPALESGQKYWFDFFYCERNTSTSNIYISTNMLLYVPPQPTKRSWKRDYGNLD